MQQALPVDPRPESARSVLIGGAPIDGVRFSPLEPARDERGEFTEVFANHWGSDLAPVQWSVVRSAAGVLRGMHVHDRHGEYVTIVSGSMYVGLVDIRPASPTFRASTLYHLTEGDPAYLTLPPGLLHGWLFSEASVHLQAVSEAYVSYAADDNNGCHWSDPELGIEWPFAPTIVSPRADAFPSLAQLLASRLR